MVEQINSDPAVLDALVTCDESWIYCYDPETKRQSSHWKHAGSPRPQKPKQSKSTHKLFDDPFFLTALAWFTWIGFPLDRQSTRNTIVEVLRWVQEEIPSEEASTLQIGSIWSRWALRQFLTLPIVQTLHPVTFGHSLNSRKILEAVVMGQLRKWKRLRRRSFTHSHKRTSMGPFQKLLERYNKCIAAGGDYFEVSCVVPSIKSAHTKKSLENYWWHLVYLMVCLFSQRCFDFSLSFLMEKCFIQIILVWETKKDR